MDYVCTSVCLMVCFILNARGCLNSHDNVKNVFANSSKLWNNECAHFTFHKKSFLLGNYKSTMSNDFENVQLDPFSLFKHRTFILITKWSLSKIYPSPLLILVVGLPLIADSLDNIFFNVQEALSGRTKIWNIDPCPS